MHSYHHDTYAVQPSVYCKYEVNDDEDMMDQLMPELLLLSKMNISMG
jgi:hypothetical protein